MPRSLFRSLVPALFLSACGAQAPPVAQEAPRPVEVYELRPIDPTGHDVLTGSVSSWKEQDVAFEVGGRIQFVEERGTSLSGRWEVDGDVRFAGQVLAEIDQEPYRIAVEAAEAEVKAAEEQVAVLQAQLDALLPANLRAAIAEEANAEAEYQRYLEASRDGAVAAVDLNRAKTSQAVSAAKVEQAKGAFVVREADKRSLEANLAVSRQRLEDARWKLARCGLFAPFTGEVSEVYVEAGGSVNPGQPVAHLVMMDPIQVDIAVSSETLRELRRYSEVQLSIPGLAEPMLGRVYDLATMADPRTRTFRVSIIVRNERRIGALKPGDPELALPRVQRMLVPLSAPLDSDDSWYVEERRSLHQDDQGWFVWASSDPRRAEEVDRDRPVMTLRKVRVTPGEGRQNFQGIYVLRELADAGELQADTLLPLDVPADFVEGGQVLLTEAGWLLQPGQVVSVLLGKEQPEPGLFVPMSAVLPEGDGVGRVLVVEDGEARSVRLDITDRIGPLVRVRPLDPGDAARVGPGAQVVQQAHFLHEGESVRVVRTRGVSL